MINKVTIFTVLFCLAEKNKSVLTQPLGGVTNQLKIGNDYDNKTDTFSINIILTS